MPGSVIGAEQSLDLTRFVRPGDSIVWGQACGEPQTLTELLVAQRHQIGPVRCFVGIPARSILQPESVDGLSLSSYCGTGSNAALHQAGLLEIAPVHYSRIPDLLTSGPARADVVFVQVSAADETGRHSMSLTDDYLSAVIDSAAVVIVEINDRAPVVAGARTLGPGEWTAAVRSSREPAQMESAHASEVVHAVARNVASLIEDGATLQFGIGAVPEAVLRELHGRRDLGIHSGVLNEAAMELMESGAATGARKSLDRGIAVAGFVTGTRRLFDFVDRNPAVNVRSTGYTHDSAILSAQHALAAINSAIEVDVFGAVNAEVAAGKYVGAVGGAMDFLRGAAASRGGLPIVAMPSSARGRSRIVAALGGPVSTPRADAAIIVTENGIADLRGLSLERRVEEMLRLADPVHRGELAAAAEPILRGEHQLTRGTVR